MTYKDKEKQKEYQREWIAERRNSYLKEKFCVICGSIENLEIHHKDPKEKTSHRIWSWSEEKRLKELDKCEILCEFCHIEHHRKLNTKNIHGTTTLYGNGCRCDLCREANTKAKRLWRAKVGHN